MKFHTENGVVSVTALWAFLSFCSFFSVQLLIFHKAAVNVVEIK